MGKIGSPQIIFVSELTNRDRYLYFTCKRILDMVVVSLSLILLAPLMLFIAILIKLDSPGPVIFRQKRVGARRRIHNGSCYWEQSTFTFYKFRTMKAGTNSNLHRQFVQAYIAGDERKMAQIRSDSKAKNKYKLTNDPRVTKLGQFLRKTSLDEIPQLWNVLKGEMSLVGPRPPIPYEVDMYKPWHRQRLATIPGITGLWQSTGRSSANFDEMVRLDLEYIEKQSLWLDLKILLWTVPAVILAKGAR